MLYSLYDYYKNSSLSLDEIVDHYVARFYSTKHDGKDVLKVLSKVRESSKIKNLCGHSATRGIAPNYVDFASVINEMWYFMFKSNMTQALAVLFAAMYWDEKVNNVYHLLSEEDLRNDIIKIFMKYQIMEEIGVEEQKNYIEKKKEEEDSADNLATSSSYSQYDNNPENVCLQNKADFNNSKSKHTAYIMIKKKYPNGEERFKAVDIEATILTKQQCIALYSYISFICKKTSNRSDAVQVLNNYGRHMNLSYEDIQSIIIPNTDFKESSYYPILKTIINPFEVNIFLYICNSLIIDFPSKEIINSYYEIAEQLGYSKQEVRSILSNIRMDFDLLMRLPNNLLSLMHKVEDRETIFSFMMHKEEERRSILFNILPTNLLFPPYEKLYLEEKNTYNAENLSESDTESEQILTENKDISDMKEPIENMNKEDSGNTWTDEYGVEYDKEKRQLIKASKNIEKYTVIEGTKVIGNAAFSDCTLLKEIVLPDSVVEIGHYAFANNKELKFINIPKNAFIFQKSNPFAGCINLHSIKWESKNAMKEGTLIYNKERTVLIACLPWHYVEGVKKSWKLLSFAREYGKMQVGEFEKDGKKFSSCIFTNLTDNSRTFVGFSSKIGELSPKEIVAMKDELLVVQFISGYYYLCKGKYIIEPDSRVVIPYGVKSIAANAFYKDEYLNEITLPETIEEIGKGAFNGCSSLEAIYIPKGTSSKFETMLTEWRDRLIEEEDDLPF